MATGIALVGHQTCRHQINLHGTVATRFSAIKAIRDLNLVLIVTFFALVIGRPVVDDVLAVARLTLNY